MEIKHTISFKIRTYGLKGGKYQIRLRISFNGFRHDVVTGCVLLDRNAWDEKAELVKDGYVGLRGETAASMNSRLRMLRDQMKDTIKYFEANDINPDEQMLQDKFEEKISRFITPKPRPTTAPDTRPKNVLAVFDEFMDDCGTMNAWSEGTYGKMRSLKVDLREFRKNRYGSPAKFRV